MAFRTDDCGFAFTCNDANSALGLRHGGRVFLSLENRMGRNDRDWPVA